MKNDMMAVEFLGRLVREAARHLAERHRERLRERDSQALNVADKMPDNSFYLNLTWRQDPLEAKLIAGGEKRDDLLRGGIMACSMQPDPRPSRPVLLSVA